MPEFYGPDSAGAAYYGGDGGADDAPGLLQSIWSGGEASHGLFIDGAG